MLPADVPTVIVLDTVGDHTGHPLRAHWQRRSDRFHPFWLPAYSPHRTLLAPSWRFRKNQLRRHPWWNDRDHLQEAITLMLAHLTAHFHTDDPPAFHLHQNFSVPA